MWMVIQQYPSRAYFPNGEAMRDVQSRAVNALEELVKKHPRGRIAVVSHSDVIKMIVAHYMGMHLDLFQRIEISPASLTILSMGASRPVLVQLNETSYLPRPQKSEQRPENGKEPVAVQSITLVRLGHPEHGPSYLKGHLKRMEPTPFFLKKSKGVIWADKTDNLLRALSEIHPDF